MFYILGLMTTSSLGDFELAVLLTVAALDEGYGAAVRRDVSRRLGRACTVGAVYTTLQRLEDKRLLRSYATEPTPVRGGRSRRCYELTPEGHRALRDARQVQGRLWEGVPLPVKPT